jgi:hypothetical protein
MESMVHNVIKGLVLLFLLSDFFSVRFLPGGKMAATVPGIPSILHHLEKGGLAFGRSPRPVRSLLSPNPILTLQ